MLHKWSLKNRIVNYKVSGFYVDRKSKMDARAGRITRWAIQTKRAFSTYHSLNKIQRQELLALRKHLGSNRYIGGSVVLLIFSVFCVVFFVVCLRPVSWYLMLSVSLDCPFVIASSVFSNVYSCCQCLWIVHSWLSLRFSLTFIHVASIYGLSILYFP